MTIHKNMHGDDQRAIMVSGGFDPVHIGHIRMILDAARHGDVLLLLIQMIGSSVKGCF